MTNRKNDRYYDINTNSPINFYTYLISFIFPSNFNVELYMKKMNIIDEYKQKVYKIYDVDLKNGRFIPKDQVEITNSSYVTISHSRKFLYSITDFGIEAYKI